MGLPARIVSVVVGLLILFITLGAVVSACGASREPGEGPQPPPTSSATSDTSSPSPDLPRPSVPPRPSPTITETVTEEVTETATKEAPDASSPASEAGVYYKNCDEARAAGAAPLIAGEPGYRPELDRDGDGVACETEG